MSGEDPVTVLVMDTNVLINLIHVERLGLLSRLGDFRFVVPENVVEEVRDAGQKAELQAAIAGGCPELVKLEDPAELALFADLQKVLDDGESACLAAAEHRGWWLASDEKGRLVREVEARLGAGKLLGTKDLYLRWIQAGVLEIEDADGDKAFLEGKRFKMNFGSFRELFGGP